MSLHSIAPSLALKRLCLVVQLKEVDDEDGKDKNGVDERHNEETVSIVLVNDNSAHPEDEAKDVEDTEGDANPETAETFGN